MSAFGTNRTNCAGLMMNGDAAAERYKDRLSRDFWGCSIFDFCNNIDPKRTLNTTGHSRGFAAPELAKLCAYVSNATFQW